MSVKIQLRRDDASVWTSENPILALGEPGFETDTNQFKIGNGSGVWTSLDYMRQDFVSVVSGSGLADLTPPQQSGIKEGSLVLTTDGYRWFYSGSGPKTSGTSYVQMADVSPDWAQIVSKPASLVGLADITSTAIGDFILATGNNTYQVVNFAESVDDRVGSLVISGTGININYNDNANSLTISASGLISNPTNNRILTSRDNTTTGIDAESNLTFDGNLLNVTGSGSFSSNLQINNQTASTIAAFDVSKNVSSLATATYPSLTELTYVKDVTSAIQTQLGNKANSAITITAGSGLAGGGDLSSNRSVDIGQGDGITVSTDSIAVNSTVVRTTGSQTISATHTFSGATVFGSNVTASGNLTVTGDVSANYYFGDFDGPVIYDCRNNTGSTINKGTPVYISGHYANGKVDVSPAEADNSAKMPALGLLGGTLTPGQEGHVHMFGALRNLDTSAYSDPTDIGKTLYVASGGGLTLIRPTGESVLIQNIARIARIHNSNGRLLVLGPARTNDVPNSISAYKLDIDNIRIDGNTLSSTSGNIIINPIGTGALQRDSGGNTRGQYAVDWQTVRSSGTMVAGGDYSVLGGGSNNASNGINSTVGGGTNNIASGNYSAILGGQYNNANHNNVFILGSNITSTQANTTYVQNLDVAASGDIDTLKINKFFHNNLAVASSLGDNDLLIAIINPTGTATTEVIQGSVLRSSLLNQPSQLQFRQGTDAERLLIIPASGEPIWTTDSQKFYIGDGTTVGGDLVNLYDRGVGTNSVLVSNSGCEAIGSNSAVLGGINNLTRSNNSFIGGGNNNVTALKVRRANQLTSVTNTITVLDALVADFNSTTPNALKVLYLIGLALDHRVVSRTVSSATQSGTDVNVVLTANVGGAGLDTWYQVIVVNTAESDSSTTGQVINGGRFNLCCGTDSVVGGGNSNSIIGAGKNCVIGGGNINLIKSTADESVIGGGYYNTVWGGPKSYIGGGGNNTIGSSDNLDQTHQTICGGYNNTINTSSDLVGGCFIGGGMANEIIGDQSYHVICGGYSNYISAQGYPTATIVGGYNNTIDGDYSGGSFIGAGQDNTITIGYYSTISAGRSNAGSADYSIIPGGREAKTTRYGELSHSAGKFTNNGDAQHTTLIARRSTADATPNVVLTLNSETPGGSNRLTVPAETTWAFTIKLSAYNDTDNEGGWWIFRGGIRRNATNGTALIGSLITESGFESSLNTASTSVVADDTNEALEIRVTGVVSKNIRWVAVVDISQVSYGTP